MKVSKKTVNTIKLCLAIYGAYYIYNSVKYLMSVETTFGFNEYSTIFLTGVVAIADFVLIKQLIADK